MHGVKEYAKQITSKKQVESRANRVHTMCLFPLAVSEFFLAHISSWFSTNCSLCFPPDSCWIFCSITLCPQGGDCAFLLSTSELPTEFPGCYNSRRLWSSYTSLWEPQIELKYASFWMAFSPPTVHYLLYIWSDFNKYTVSEVPFITIHGDSLHPLP